MARDEQDQTVDTGIDEALAGLMAGVAQEPVSDRLRQLALRLAEALEQQQIVQPAPQRADARPLDDQGAPAA